jgi:hypothetical protein
MATLQIRHMHHDVYQHLEDVAKETGVSVSILCRAILDDWVAAEILQAHDQLRQQLTGRSAWMEANNPRKQA